MEEKEKTTEERKSWVPDDINYETDAKLILFEKDDGTFIAVNPAIGPDAVRDLLFGSLLELITGKLVMQMQQASMKGFIAAQRKIAEAHMNKKIIEHVSGR